jgi:hypothetical protein
LTVLSQVPALAQHPAETVVAAAAGAVMTDGLLQLVMPTQAGIHVFRRCDQQ